MPTQLVSGRRYPKAELGGDLDYRPVTVSAPWLGYCPDLSPHLVGYNAFYDVFGIVPSDGILTIDSGWVQLDDGSPYELPLGGELTPPNTPLAPAPAGYEQPVILIAELFRSDGQHDPRNILVATGLTVPPTVGAATCGFCWYYNNGDWQNVPYNIIPPAAHAGGDPAKPDGLEAERENLFDWAPYPLGGTAIGIKPGLIVFTNKYDEVYAWDIEDVTLGAGPPGAYCSAFGTELGGARFYAKSVELYDDRLCFLNTREAGGDEHYRRFRWTSLTPNAFAPNVAGITGVGSGFLDLDEFNGEGLRVLKFEDRAALYFTDGVAIVNRTFNVTNPFNRQYLTKERGLLGTFAVTRMDGDRHFGLFTDGWFILNSNGQWLELGRFNTGSGVVDKWKRTFYHTVDIERRDQIVVSYDGALRRIRIGFPTTISDGYTVWVYDIDTDTVWPDYPYTVTIWGSADSQLTYALPWNDPLFTGSTWPEITGSWADYAATYGTDVVLHGSEDGYVYVHSSIVAQRDQVDVQWMLKSHLQDYGSTYSVKTGDRMSLRHGTLGIDSVVSVGFFNEENIEVVRNINLNVDVDGATATSTVHPRLAGDTLGLIAAGVGPVEIYSFRPAILGASVAPAKDVL